MNSRIGITEKNYGYRMNCKYDFVTIKDGLWTNSRLGFAEKNDGYDTNVRNENVVIKDGS